MNFELLSEKYKEIKSPETNISAKTNEEGESSGFIHFLKNQENQSKRKYYRMYILYAIGAVAYLFVFIINPDSELSAINRLMGASFIVSFAILLVLFRKRYAEINRASFLESPKQFLISARKRHTLWNKQQLWFIPVLLLIDFGATLSISKYLENIQPGVGILLFQLVFWGLMTIGFIMGKKEWTRNKKPILLKIEKMLADFET